MKVESRIKTDRTEWELGNAKRPLQHSLDIRLPDQNGFLVLRTLQELAPQIPAVVNSAQRTRETIRDAMNEGAFAYLLKPVDFAQIREVLEHALHTSGIGRQNRPLR